MVFSSLGFLYLFLPAALILHYVVPGKGKNIVLLVLSMLFYFIGEQWLLVIMMATVVIAYFAALGMEFFSEKPILRRTLLIVALILSLSALIRFKYADLLIESFNLLTGAAVPLLRTALPIGISFYTFQTISYVVDVYAHRCKAERSLINFATYVTLFPQLIAGPIVRYDAVAEDLRERRVDISGYAGGIRRFCLGLAKKVLLANTLASFTAMYADVSEHTLLFAWVCGIAQPLQIYFDFSGYSDMAIGLGKMLGFSFPENFDHPFLSRSATEFWRRWHISLGSWFRDYIYIPLGGNRRGAARQVLNLLIVWAVTGLWHGAEYIFILWGLYYGVLILAEKFLYGKFLARSRVLSRLYFALITVIGFEFISAADLSDLGRRIGELFGVGICGFSDVFSLYYVGSYAFLILLAFIFSFPLIKLLGRFLKRPRPALFLRVCADLLSIAALLLCTAYLVDGSFNPFLYFRF